MRGDLVLRARFHSVGRRQPVRAGWCLPQNLAFDQRLEDDGACAAFESPQPLRLRNREDESWHLAVLSFDPLKEFEQSRCVLRIAGLH